MAIISRFLVVLSILSVSASSMPTTHASNHTANDLQGAIADIRSKSFYGFAILLQMLNSSMKVNLQDITFFIPEDPQLSNISISTTHLEDFVLSHTMPMPLEFNDLVHFPSGSVVPSGFHNRMMKIHNRGRSYFAVSNAKITVPNICLGSDTIKCHGVDAVIDYGNTSYD